MSKSKAKRALQPAVPEYPFNLVKQPNDFTVARHGNLFILTPLTDIARDWLDENVPVEGWQRWGGGIVVDQHYIEDLVYGIQGEGFIVVG